ncbi:MAG: SAM-dependent DNA methyltransferase, partial [Aquificae bacterium]|nr:SAM-dependent DNA methyltransferase [Aquificota bacterium]
MPKRESIVRSEIKTVCDIMRRDDGTNATVDYMEQLSWMLFLKIHESIEEKNEELALLEGRQYIPVIDKKFRWSNWARNKDWLGKPKESLAEFVENVEEEFKKLQRPEDALIHFIDNILFPYLRNLSGTPEREKVAEIF